MRTFALLLSVFIMLVFAIGCGGGGTTPEDTTGTISGTVYAPNGTDPISEALVYVEDRSGGAVGDPPTEPYQKFTYTAANGTFSLTAIPTGVQYFKVIKGAFTKSFQYSVVEGSNSLAATLTTLPSSSGGGNEVGKMAVVTGLFDSIENVLAKLGLGTVDAGGLLELGTETFTIIDGDQSLSDADYYEFLDFFADPANYADYRTIFINCGNVWEYDFFASATMMNGLRDWVHDGGRLYVTDQAYDYVEQLFPEYIDFYGSDPGLSSTPETWGDAEAGDGFDETDATILNTALLNWLRAIGATNTDDTVTIEGWLGAWVPIDAISTNANAYVQAPVWADGTESTRIITTTFEYGDGLVFFSSYHTEDMFSTSITPQDRILQYFVFEVL